MAKLGETFRAIALSSMIGFTSVACDTRPSQPTPQPRAVPVGETRRPTLTLISNIAEPSVITTTIDIDGYLQRASETFPGDFNPQEVALWRSTQFPSITRGRSIQEYEQASEVRWQIAIGMLRRSNLEDFNYTANIVDTLEKEGRFRKNIKPILGTPDVRLFSTTTTEVDNDTLTYEGNFNGNEILFGRLASPLKLALEIGKVAFTVDYLEKHGAEALLSPEARLETDSSVLADQAKLYEQLYLAGYKENVSEAIRGNTAMIILVGGNENDPLWKKYIQDNYRPAPLPII